MSGSEADALFDVLVGADPSSGYLVDPGGRHYRIESVRGSIVFDSIGGYETVPPAGTIERVYYRLPGIREAYVCGEKIDPDDPLRICGKPGIAWRRNGQFVRAHTVCAEHKRPEDEEPRWQDER